MKRRAWLLAACAALAATHTSAVVAQKPPPVGELKSLGGDRFQIGRIVIDKRAGRFTVPGRIHVIDRPLEYLATSPRGLKEYETLLELDATGSEFNLACILLGLERDPKQGPYYQFSKAPLLGPRVAIHVAWTEEGRRRQVSAAEAVLNPDAGVKPESVEWVYMASLPAQADRPFAADLTGTLIGFVHDPATVIDTVHGIGIGAYGSVRGNAALLPPKGSPVELIVEAVRAKK